MCPHPKQKGQEKDSILIEPQICSVLMRQKLCRGLKLHVDQLEQGRFFLQSTKIMQTLILQNGEGGSDYAFSCNYQLCIF